MSQQIIDSESVLPDCKSSEDLSENEDATIMDGSNVENETLSNNMREKVNYDNYIDELLASDSDNDINEIDSDNVTSNDIQNKEIENYEILKSDSNLIENKILKIENGKMKKEDVDNYDTNILSNDETNNLIDFKVAANQTIKSDIDLNISNNPIEENVKIEPEEIEIVDIDESPNYVNALYNASVQDAVRYFSGI